MTGDLTFGPNVVHSAQRSKPPHLFLERQDVRREEDDVALRLTVALRLDEQQAAQHRRHRQVLPCEEAPRNGLSEL